MSSNNSEKTEKAAVQAVKRRILPCELLEDRIPECDKEPLVDGCIEIYNSGDRKTANLIGKIPVQVKGTRSKLKRNKKGIYKYSISTNDLRQYASVFHGVMFFCVTVGEIGGIFSSKEIYYAQLLPYDIDRYIQSAPGQKSVSVRFKPFPEDSREITRLIGSFHADREKQLKAEVTGYGFMDETHELPPEVSSWEFTVRVFPDELPTSLALFSEGPYIYSKDASGQLAVIGKMQGVCAIGVGSEASVASGDFSLVTTLFSGQSEEGDFIEFEGIRIVQSGDKVRVDYTVKGGFRRRYNTVAFVREFYRTGEIFINGKRVIGALADHDDEAQKDKIDKNFIAYSRVMETMDALHVKVDWDPVNMTANELRDIDYMHALFVEKKPYKGKDFESCLVHFDIQGARVFSFAHKEENGNGYEFYDLYSTKLFFVFSDETDDVGDQKRNSDPVPPIASLTKESLKRIANLDPIEVEAAFNRFPITVNNHIPLNQFLLELLAAYDEGCVLSSEVLGCAAVLARKLYDFDSKSNAYFLNLMQTIKRKRDFVDDEVDRLRDIALDSEFNYEKAAAYALLDEKDMAERCRIRCSEAERMQIDSYPISIFFGGACI